MIDSPGRLGPLLAPLCWRSVQVLPQQEFDQEGQLLTNAGFTLQTTTPRGDVCGLPRTDLHLYDAGQRSGPPHAVTGVDVVAQFGDKTYLATVTVQTTAADNPNYVRDCHDNPQGIPGAAARRGQPLLSRRMPARWRRGAVGDVLTAQLGFDEFLGERVLVTVDLNTAAWLTPLLLS